LSLYKRSGTWWIRFTTPSGERVRCSARTCDKAEAQELHDKLRADAWRVHKLGEKPRRTWDEAALKWLQETEKVTIKEDKAKVRWLQPFFRTKYLDSIDRELIGTLATRKAEQSSPPTANRYLALIRAILRKAAFEWEWMGMDRPGAEGKAVPGSKAAHTVDYAGAGSNALARVTTASGRYRVVRFIDRAAAGERVEAGMVAGRS
jgi:hypothetical protein